MGSDSEDEGAVAVGLPDSRLLHGFGGLGAPGRWIQGLGGSCTMDSRWFMGSCPMDSEDEGAVAVGLPDSRLLHGFRVQG